MVQIQKRDKDSAKTNHRTVLPKSVSKMKLELRIKEKYMHEQTSENRFTHYLIKCQDCLNHNGLGNNTIQIIFLLK